MCTDLWLHMGVCASPVEEQLWAGWKAWGGNTGQLLCSYVLIHGQVSMKTTGICAGKVFLQGVSTWGHVGIWQVP